MGKIPSNSGAEAGFVRVKSLPPLVVGSTPTAPTNLSDFKSLAGTFDTNKAFDTN